MDAKQARLTGFLEALEVGDPFGHRNLTLIPLGGNDSAQLDYVLGADAIEAGTLTVTEVDEGGSVPELLVNSTADTISIVIKTPLAENSFLNKLVIFMVVLITIKYYYLLMALSAMSFR